MKRAIATLLLVSGMVTAQQPAPPTPTLTPKETKAVLTVQLAVERQTSVSLQAQLVQKTIEPQMQELQKRFSEQAAIVAASSNEVRKENGWGPEVSLDTNPQSPTYMKWVKGAAAPPPPPPPPAAVAPAEPSKEPAKRPSKH